MFVRLKNLVIAVIAGSILMGAAGCTPEAEPAEPTGATQSESPAPTSAKPTQSPTPKPTPTPVPASSKGPAQNWPVPVMPAVAKEKSEAGIKAFALHYYDLVEYTIQTNDTVPIKKVTMKTCLECGASFIDPFDNNKKVGSWMSGADFEVVVTRTILQPQNGVVLYTTTQGEMTLFMRDGTLQGTFPATPKPAPMTMLLQFDDGWKVESLEYLDATG